VHRLLRDGQPGAPPVGVEGDADVVARQALLRELGYKL
jgi:adenosine/AMP kinase